MRRPLESVLACLAVLVLTSCALLDPDSTFEYRIHDPQVLAGESHDGAIVLFWNTTNETLYGEPPSSLIRFVRILMSKEGPDDGFRDIAMRTGGIGKDSLRVEGLENGEAYYFRLVALENVHKRAFRSAPIVCTPGVLSLPTEILEVGPPGWGSSGDFGLDWATTNWIAFTQFTAADVWEIFAWNPTTGEQRQITHSQTPESHIGALSWSPEGDRIAYTRTPSLTNYLLDYRIWSVLSSGGPGESLSPAHSFDPVWDRSDSTIVLCSDGELYRLSLDRMSAMTAITADGRRGKYGPSVRGSDGEIVFSEADDPFNHRLIVISTSGVQRRSFLRNEFWTDGRPKWSPSGTQILFTSDRSGSRQIWVADYPSGRVRQITSGRRTQVARGEACWSPDGSRIAVLEREWSTANRRISLYSIASIP